ncbi:serine/threonine-protein kinase SBK1-like [Scylla paramamosain]|uniref:serine/threonine-protein kinase SBK1-like n=1 Tax=Scylla paramamosain TaxID=85552 RepID=UPI003083C2D5
MSSAARRSHSVAVRGEGLRVAAVRRSSSARSTASCCLRRKGSTRSTSSRTSTSSATNSCGYCLSRSGAAVTRKTSSASSTGAAQQQQQRRRSSGGGAAECRRRVGQHPHLAPEEGQGWQGAARHLGELIGRRGMGEVAAKQVARQVSAALQHVHERGVVHRDALPDNILVEGRRPLMLRLAGLTLAAEEGALVRRGDCPEAWLPPEVLALLPAEGYAAHPAQDAWQLGLLLVVCLTGALPWAAADTTDPHYAAWAAWARRASTRMPSRFKSFSPRFLRLLRRLLQPRPELRAGVREVDKYLQDAWMGGEETKGAASGRLRRRVSGLLARAGASLTRLLGPAPLSPTPQPKCASPTPSRPPPAPTCCPPPEAPHPPPGATPRGDDRPGGRPACSQGSAPHLRPAPRAGLTGRGRG